MAKEREMGPLNKPKAAILSALMQADPGAKIGWIKLLRVGTGSALQSLTDAKCVEWSLDSSGNKEYSITEKGRIRFEESRRDKL